MKDRPNGSNELIAIGGNCHGGEIAGETERADRDIDRVQKARGREVIEGMTACRLLNAELQSLA
ncbi:hypothetical protein BS628_00885 [Agrobacterium radiobacter]|nr:hypothetical protein ASH09_25940 [Agrobacterium radiobacter]OOO40373.1 hypothetical protein BS628_00885 [Agrobacterium radiobacter]